MSDRPTVALVGPGAIGTTLAALLHAVHRTPMLCGRTAYPQLRLRDENNAITVPGPVNTDPDAVAGPVDVVLLAVKATQVVESAPWLARLCAAHTLVCALQNGVEQHAALTPWVNGAEVLPSVVWFPAQREADASVWLRASPRLTLPNVPGAQRIVELLRDTGCEVALADDFVSVAWRKLLQNAAAGVMVLANRRAGVFARSDISALTLVYLNECLAVARAAGATLDDSVIHDILDGFHRAPADLSTSILADRQANRPLEWDIRNGVIQRYGRQYGIPTPVSDVMVPLLAAASEGPG
ncbi:oxidoreductase [Pantoea sp. Mb-10]|uniref:oxidoreductase n=1 Tax=unclassified Pantoea TaxID=2630326 RepID=UPI001E3D7158|nr:MULTISPECIES: oxidoreductase [unclassified Pantoea]MCE0491152.1 oxidoreductase [Pantoea sp. Mb-10]MCE0502641.1 oxidoreductase [Pantoea sp. Pb-8]